MIMGVSGGGELGSAQWPNRHNWTNISPLSACSVGEIQNINKGQPRICKLSLFGGVCDTFVAARQRVAVAWPACGNRSGRHECRVFH